MKKSALICLLLLIANIASANATETWQCALNLQQGDKGSMTLELSDASLSGTINIDRNGSEFTQELDGRWIDREVEIKRYISSNSNQTMHGIAIQVGAEQVKMGGRYAEGLNGVWSADCDLVSQSAKEPADSSEQEPVQVAPSISVRATPFRPSNHQTIQFSAQAVHPQGIESITFYLNDKSIHRCESAQCSVKHGPLKAGNYQWHAIAKSNNGVANTKSSNNLLVGDAGGSGSCTISGIATGPAVAESSKVTLELKSNNSKRIVGKSTRFDAGTYRFANLATGSYVLSIKAPDSLGIIVSPTTAQVECQPDRAKQQNFDFR